MRLPLFLLFFALTPFECQCETAAFHSWLANAPNERTPRQRFLREMFIRKATSTTCWSILIHVEKSKPSETSDPHIHYSVNFGSKLMVERTQKLSLLRPISFNEGIRLFDKTNEGIRAYVSIDAIRVCFENITLADLPRLRGNYAAPLMFQNGIVDVSKVAISRCSGGRLAGAILVDGDSDIEIAKAVIEKNQGSVGAIRIRNKAKLDLASASLFQNIGQTVGGIMVEERGFFTAIRSTFEDNVSGDRAADLYMTGKTMGLVSTCQFIGSGWKKHLSGSRFSKLNTATNLLSKAGAIAMDKSAALIVDRSLFFSYISQQGTIDLSGGGVASILRCELFNNTAVKSGGGLHANLKRGGYFKVKDTIFRNNAARHGGAVAVEGRGSSAIISCTFVKNQALSGGAIWNRGTIWRSRFVPLKWIFFPKMVVVSSRFSNNTAIFHGGALYIFARNVTINGTSFEANVAVRGKGGAAMIQSGSVLKVLESNFTRNSAGSEGGSVFVEKVDDVSYVSCLLGSNTAASNGGAIFAKIVGRFQISETIFYGNFALCGGGIKGEYLKLWVTRSRFKENVGYKDGGALHLEDNSLEIQETKFLDCRAGRRFIFSSPEMASALGNPKENSNIGDGGAIWMRSGTSFKSVESTFKDNRSAMKGGAISLEGIDRVYVHRSLFYNDTAERGGAIAAFNVSQVSMSTNKFQNCAAFVGGALDLGDVRRLAAENNTFTNNSASSGGAFLCGGTTKIDMFGSQFYGNEASKGSAVVADCSCSVEFDYSEFRSTASAHPRNLFQVNTTCARLNCQDCIYSKIDGPSLTAVPLPKRQESVL